MTTLIEAVEASIEHIAARLAQLGDHGTAGPVPEPAAPVVPHQPAPRWTDGWWAGARRLPAHPGRTGGPIRPWAAGIHTTDMLPEEWPALLAAWTGRAGDGACANFLIGRDEQRGTVQLIPITRNGNHMGGPGHGVFRVGGVDMHPNLCAVGIEVHCAGGVVRINGAWRLVEGGVAHGATIPDVDVIPDPQRPGRGWHVVTDYQRTVLGQLLDDLELVLGPVPPRATKVAFGEVPPRYAVLAGPRVATHAEMDPVHRADPWPPTCDWLRIRTS